MTAAAAWNIEGLHGQLILGRQCKQILVLERLMNKAA